MEMGDKVSLATHIQRLSHPVKVEHYPAKKNKPGVQTGEGAKEKAVYNTLSTVWKFVL